MHALTIIFQEIGVLGILKTPTLKKTYSLTQLRHRLDFTGGTYTTKVRLDIVYTCEGGRREGVITMN